MGEHPSRRKPTDAEVPDQGYELDLDEHSSEELNEAIRDAVDAVERASQGRAGHEPADQGDGEPQWVESEEARDEERRTGEAAAAVSEDLDMLRSEAEGLRQRLLRTLADFDNYRKRTEREKETLRRMGNFELIRDFLEVIDNLERAQDSSGGVEDLKAGLEMILRQQQDILRRHGVERIASVGRPFDPTLHEAVARQETTDVGEPTVTAEMQSGYLLHDRLLRPAMVHVALPAAPPGPEAAGENIDQDVESD